MGGADRRRHRHRVSGTGPGGRPARGLRQRLPVHGPRGDPEVVRPSPHGPCTPGDIDGWLKVFLGSAAGPFRSPDELDPRILDHLREMALHTIAKHTPGERNWHVPMTDTWARVPKIDVPVLTVNGALDSPDLLADAERFAGTARDGRSVLWRALGTSRTWRSPRSSTPCSWSSCADPLNGAGLSCRPAATAPPSPATAPPSPAVPPRSRRSGGPPAPRRRRRPRRP